MTTPPTADSDRSSPWSSPWWQASALFLVVLIVMAAIVLVTTGGDDSQTDNAAPGAATPSSASPSASSGGSKGTCPATEESRELPRTAPAAEWTLFRTVAVPVSKEAGPLRVNGDVAECYAHSPTGALVAAAQIGTRYAFADDWERVVKRQTYGDGKQLLLDKRREFEKDAPSVAPVPGELGQFAGYQYVTYTPQTAVIQVVSRFTSGVLQASTVTLRWDESRGDWQYEIPSTSPPQKTVEDLSGYIPWGGV